jgi:hypothetical protein
MNGLPYSIFNLLFLPLASVTLHALRRSSVMHLIRFLFCCLLLASPVLADDTALNEGGQSPMPVGGINGPESIIQMKSETVDVQMGKKFSEVDCHFIFRSHKATGPAVQLWTATRLRLN